MGHTDSIGPTDLIGPTAGGLAHDFNNVLGAIQMYANILDRGLQAQAREGAGDPARRDKMVREVGKIREVANRGSSLVTQLLFFGREVNVPAEVLDLNQSIRELEELVRDTLGGQIVLHTRLDPTGMGVAAGPNGRTNMERVLLNLVINARDAMARGGTLTIQTDTVDVDADSAVGVNLKPGRYARLSVSDTGTGMSRETRHRAFEPFFTTKPSGPGPGHGTGLGLATVRGIVQQAGGDVQLYSEPDFGTLVRVYLPSAQARVSPPAATLSRPSLPAAGRAQTAGRILLAGFEADRLATARASLAGCGFAVLTAATAHEALAASQRCPVAIHLLIVDLNLPGMTACELAQRLHIARPGLKVLTVADPEPVFLDAALGLPTVHLASPFSEEDLQAAVRQALAAPPWDPSQVPPPEASAHPAPVTDRPGFE